MKRPHSFPVLISGLFVLVLGGCSHKSTKPLAAEIPNAQIASLPQHTILLQEARLEAEQLRAELASLKILMAKQSGELRILQNQGRGVQQREQERGVELQNIRSELLASQDERDQLRRRNVELEGQIGGLANTNQLVTEIQTLRTSFQQVLTNLKDLTTDLTLIKKAMHVPSNTPTPQKIALAATSAPGLSKESSLPDSTGRIVIQEGDTLWKLANRHHVSVEQLKEWNHLSTNLIMTGLRLRVASPETPPNTSAPAQVPTASESQTLPTQSEARAAPPNEGISSAEPTRNSDQSETKNLLSVSTP
ncbi:MAG: LysM peptidoglycan-binding domain-containing protein [Nitrospirales bacterium]